MQVVLENEALKVTINSFGAELASIRGKATDTEYLWNADAKFWKRTAPVLFPFVGSLKNKEYHYEGKTYSMGQHGFARDMEFAVEWVPEQKDMDMVQTATEAWFSLQSNEETKAKFPLEFILKIGYELEGKDLKVIWQVENPDTKTLYFSIGGHPAFMCPVDGKGKQSEYYFKFDTDKDLTYGLVADDGQGLMGQQKDVLPVKNGYAQITEHLFDRDALIVEDRQALAVSLCTPDKKPYVTLNFDAPLFGLWSPAGKGAPFICIEPWYGRCDKTTFDGSLEQREYSNTLQAGEVFRKEYIITIE